MTAIVFATNSDISNLFLPEIYELLIETRLVCASVRGTLRSCEALPNRQILIPYKNRLLYCHVAVKFKNVLLDLQQELQGFLSYYFI